MDKIAEYNITNVIGQGGFGTVALGVHQHLGTRAAIKVLHTDSPDAHARFKKEAQVAEALEHPHLLPIKQFGLTNPTDNSPPQPFLVMPYIGDDEGPMDLVRYIESKGGALDPETATLITQQILDALAHAHAQGVIHRDLKPRNVLVSEKNGKPHALIADFGLVRVVGEAAVRDKVAASISQSMAAKRPDQISRTLDAGSSATGSQTASLVGTWEYMSPESKTGAEATEQSDIFAAGLLAHYMLTGRLPKAFGEHDQRVTGILTWLGRALADDPAERFQTATEAAEALAPRGKASKRTKPKKKSNAVPLTIAAAAAIALIAAVGFFVASQASSGGASRGGAQSDKTQVTDDAADRATTPIPGPTTDPNPNPPVTIADVLPIRVKAAKTKQTIDALDPAQGFDARIDELDTQHATAEAFFEQSLYAEALQAFESFGEDAQSLIVLDAERQTAAAARSAWQTAMAELPSPLEPKASEDAPEEWNTAESATAHFESGRFAEAAAAWDALVPAIGAVAERNAALMVARFADEAEAAARLLDASMLWRDRQAAPAEWFPEDSITASVEEAETLAARGDNTSLSVAARMRAYQEATVAWNRAIEDHTSTVREGDAFRIIAGPTSSVEELVFSPDGLSLASTWGDDTVRLWDPVAANLTHTLYGHIEATRSVAFSSDGQVLASASGNMSSNGNIIVLSDAQTGRTLRTLRGHTNTVDSVSFSPDGLTLASGSWDHTVRLWSASTGKSVRRLRQHTNEVCTVSFSPDGQTLASGAVDKTIVLWDPSNGSVRRILRGHGNTISALAFSSNGQTLASAALDDTVRLWDPASGRELHTLRGHAENVNTVSFSSDGQILASGADDGTVRFWDVSNGQQVFRIDLPGDCTAVAFSPADDRVAIAGEFVSDELIKTCEIREYWLPPAVTDRALAPANNAAPAEPAANATPAEPAAAAPNHLDRKTVEFAPGVTAEFVYIDAPTVAPDGFLMGSPEDEEGRDDDETQHRVHLTRGYWMQTTEVTQAQWQAVMAGNPSHFKNGPDYPVEKVSWDDCQQFITKLGERGISARLPTEAQWEFACRAGTTTAYAWGDDPNDPLGRFSANGHDVTSKRTNRSDRTHFTWDDEYQFTAPSGPARAQARANVWGLYDMHGNVSEWCQDLYGSYPGAAVTDPMGPQTGSYRVLRGGSWVDAPRDLRSARRRLSRGTIPNIIDGIRLTLDSE